jgi:hypothetical protein
MDDLYKQEKRFLMLSVPLLLRLFEYVREEPTSDEDLHFMAERMQELMLDGVKMTMNQYSGIVPPESMVKQTPTLTYSQTTHAE